MKKFILTENQINVLKEYINQLQIPFEEFGDEYGKEPYDYYMDFIEEVGEKGTLPPSNTKMTDILENIIYSDILFNVLVTFIDMGGSLFDYGMIEFIENNPNCFEIEITEDDIDNKNEYWFLKSLTKNGLYKFFISAFGTIYQNLLSKLTFNENDLIYIERVVSIPFYPKYRPTTKSYLTQQQFDNETRQHAYGNMKTNYSNFGTHWSWKHGGATDFSRNSDFERKTSALIFKGLVNPNGVDWEDTILNSMINYQYEHELTLKYHTNVQINEIEWLGGGANLPLHQPIIVKA